MHGCNQVRQLDQHGTIKNLKKRKIQIFSGGNNASPRTKVLLFGSELDFINAIQMDERFSLLGLN